MLGNSNVKVTRLAFGTGSFSGSVQRELGQDGFTRLVRYAYDHGIRFFETAESYGDMHRMLGVALQGIPRDSYRLMSKVTTTKAGTRNRNLTSCANSRTPSISISCCFTGSTPLRGPQTRLAGRMHPRSGNTGGMRSRVTAHQFTAYLRCVRCPEINGSMSP